MSNPAPLQLGFDDLDKPAAPILCPRCATQGVYDQVYLIEECWTAWCPACHTVRISDGAKLVGRNYMTSWLPKEASE